MKLSTALFSVIIVLSVSVHRAQSRSFTIDYERDCFLKDGKEFRYISGGFHYFRVPKFYWKDRLLKIKAAGLNAIQSYVPWNFHEPTPGVYKFDGDADLLSFIELIHETGLLLVLRAGPYICSEWDFGGFPGWLLKNQSIILRSSHDKAYMDAITSWMTFLLAKIKPYLYSNGGPIISVQVENEYGIYPICDHNYMKYLQELFEKVLGKDKVILFTTNPASDGVLKCGTIPTLFNTVDFGPGDNVTAAFELMRKYQAHGPLVNSEFYTGWLDNWGKPHQTRSSEIVADMLDDILKRNASVNFYMFIGGTNFGFMNGANYNYHPNRYQAQPTSYDYDAPLSEAGDITDKYYAVRNIIGKYLPIPPGPVPPSSPKHAYGKIAMSKASSVSKLLNGYPFSWIKSQYPLSMEQLGYYYGYVVYKTALSVQDDVTLSAPGVRDRAVVYCDKIRQGVLDRNGPTDLKINTKGCANLLILVENQGRINAGPKMTDPKGIIKNVTINNNILVNWEAAHFSNIFNLFSENVVNNEIEVSENDEDTSGVYIGSFSTPSSLKAPQDSYLLLKGWNKGQVYINGFNLGRYWPVEGPQITLYVPANILNVGWVNVVVVFEINEAPCVMSSSCNVEFVTTPILNGTVPGDLHQA